METEQELPDRRFVRNRKYAISKVWDIHSEIVRRLVIGQKAVDIAADLGITEAMVSYTRNSPIVKRQLEIQHGARDAYVLNVNKAIADLAPIALEKKRGLLENNNLPNLQFKAAQEVLDRVSPKVTHVAGIQARLSGDDLLKLRDRAVAAASEAGITIECAVIESANDQPDTIQ